MQPAKNQKYAVLYAIGYAKKNNIFLSDVSAVKFQKRSKKFKRKRKIAPQACFDTKFTARRFSLNLKS